MIGLLLSTAPLCDERARVPSPELLELLGLFQVMEERGVDVDEAIARRREGEGDAPLPPSLESKE